MNSVMGSVDKKDFVNFEKSIKDELSTRIGNSDRMKQIKTDYDRLEGIKASFAKINKTYKKEE